MDSIAKSVAVFVGGVVTALAATKLVSAEEKKPKLKLIYFNSRGRAEIVRVVLAQGQIDYEDFRFERADWPSLKKTMPFGQVPVLEVNGQKIAQSKAVARYAAKLAGLYGDSALEAAQIDSLVDGVEDATRTLLANMRLEEAEKKEKNDKYFREEFPTWAEYFEKYLKKADGGKAFFLGKKVSLADVTFFVAMERILKQRPDVLDSSPLLADLVKRVAALPRIAKWIKERPVTEN